MCDETERRAQALIEDLARVNAHLLQSEKLASIGQLAAGVAHEINNPVGYVFSNLKTLADYVRELLSLIDAVDEVASLQELRDMKQRVDYGYIRQDVQALIGESEEGIDRIKMIIKALRDFSHVEEDAFALTDLHKGLVSTLKLVNNELKYKAEVITEFAGLPEIECSASQINQVILNLLTNAVQSIEKHGRIVIRTGHARDTVWFEVEDDGQGIQPENVSRLFDPFFTTKPVGEGTGLGLSLSYSIVTKHGGTIEVFSEPGVGSRFRVWLPVTQPTSP